MEILKDRKILVLGGRGFLGKHLLQRLSESGAEIIATSRQNSEDPRLEKLASWVSLDIRNEMAVATLIHQFQPHIIVNMAAHSARARMVDDVEEMVAVNFNGTCNLLKAASRHAVNLHRVILMGSGDEYGRSVHLPIVEEQRTHPLSPYAASKSSASHFAQVYHHLFGLPVTILRPFSVYGPGQGERNFIPDLVHSLASGKDYAMTAGQQTLDFVYVDDVTDGVLQAMTKDHPSGEVFNICSGVGHPIRAVAELVAQIIDGKARLLFGALPYKTDEVWRSFGSNEKAMRILAWKPRTDIFAGLAMTVESYVTKSDAASA